MGTPLRKIEVEKVRDIGGGDFGRVSLMNENGFLVEKAFQSQELAEQAAANHLKVQEVLGKTANVFSFYEQKGDRVYMPWVGGENVLLVSGNDNRESYLNNNEAARTLTEQPIEYIENFDAFIDSLLLQVFDLTKAGLFVANDSYFYKVSRNQSPNSVSLDVVFGDFDHVDHPKFLDGVIDFSSLLDANFEHVEQSLLEFALAFCDFNLSLELTPKVQSILKKREGFQKVLASSINENAKKMIPTLYAAE